MSETMVMIKMLSLFVFLWSGENLVVKIIFRENEGCATGVRFFAVSAVVFAWAMGWLG